MDYDEYTYQPNGRGRSSGWEILPIWLYLVRNLPRRLEISNLISNQTAAMSAYDALQAFVPSLSKLVLLARYPSCAWQECSGLAARQFGALNVLLTIVRLQAGISIHSYGAYNVGTCAAAIVLVHYVSERMIGSIRGSALSAAEVAAFVTFFWMMVQREKYVSKSLVSLCSVNASRGLC